MMLYLNLYILAYFENLFINICLILHFFIMCIIFFIIDTSNIIIYYRRCFFQCSLKKRNCQIWKFGFKIRKINLFSVFKCFVNLF